MRPDGSPVADAGQDSTMEEASANAHGDAAADALGAQDTQAGAADAGGIGCVAGGACNPQGCQNGTWACGGAGRFCETTGLVEAGTACGPAGGDAGAQVCASTGQCVACDRGGSCSDPSAPCVRKTYDCSAGTAVCTVAGNVTDGTQCDAGAYCNAGVCSACKVTAPCRPAANPCHVGEVTACTGGVPTCTDQSTPAMPGVSCTASSGAPGVCDASGTCVACTPNAACNPNGNLCQSGDQSCSSGPACVNVNNVREDLPCAAGAICHSGACVACSAASCA
ncbi:MAG TPA: hypothetical protein VN894_13115, partial [Polyangiaceae bacterium]|nr:hypothetical protein [Polyangiaceae bacterium]